MFSKAISVAFVSGFIKAAALGAALTAAPVTPAPKSFNPTNFVNTVHKEVPLNPTFAKAENLQEASGKEGIIPGSNDHGKALGPLQIHRENYTDAVQYNPALGKGYGYGDVTNRNYANSVMQSYLNRYAPKDTAAGNYNSMARTWNGGPAGPKSPNTAGYGNSIVQLMAKLKQNQYAQR